MQELDRPDGADEAYSLFGLQPKPRSISMVALESLIAFGVPQNGLAAVTVHPPTLTRAVTQNEPLQTKPRLSKTSSWTSQTALNSRLQDQSCDLSAYRQSQPCKKYCLQSWQTQWLITHGFVSFVGACLLGLCSTLTTRFRG